MLKKFALFILLALPIGLFAQTLKFGHLNSQEIIVSMPEFQKAETEMEALQKKYGEEMQRTQEEFNKKFQEFQQSVDSLPSNIAERRQRELQDMAQRQEQFQQEAYEAMQQAQGDLMMPIYKKLDDAIQSVGKSQGFTYIFDIARTSIPYINTDQSTDVTTSVKSKLGI
ncbi:MAG: OmpH family outer membrane protein [Bacteroides sp.]|nr:OmpH family outer membrane protein [Bacteroides sp.]MDD2645623.1 OmpH family outer membrane protein [Bacteroides sp.]MDD4054340.1 OmpH family outer membrane protein [Bacteroides sp.]MDD4720199.1 OmpH family outer membrane protein [Bacteroides sp.]NLI64472.1 OmpH family outer membrane protein [Bacteroidales bacterium]